MRLQNADSDRDDAVAVIPVYSEGAALTNLNANVYDSKRLLKFNFTTPQYGSFPESNVIFLSRSWWRCKTRVGVE